MLPCGDPDAVGGDDDAGDTADGNVLDPQEFCAIAGIPYDDAAVQCAKIVAFDENVWNDCIFDVCAMDGDAVAVEVREIDSRDRLASSARDRCCGAREIGSAANPHMPLPRAGIDGGCGG